MVAPTFWEALQGSPYGIVFHFFEKNYASQLSFMYLETGLQSYVSHLKL